MPISVSREAVDAALDQIDREGIAPRRRSTGCCLVARGQHYPPKVVLSLVSGIKKLRGGEPTNRAPPRPVLGVEVWDVRQSGDLD